MAVWISPSGAMNMVFDNPAKAGPDADFGFALLWSKRPGGDDRMLTADLARAKLQPRKPIAAEVRAAGAQWAVTATDHRLILASGVADVEHPAGLFDAYDRVTEPGQKLLAIVQTLKFDPSLPRHAMMHAASMYTAICLQPKRLSSLIVQHVPGDARSARRPHVHVMTLCRVHRLSGFAQIHPLFDDPPAEMHRAFEADWHRFRQTLARIGA